MPLSGSDTGVAIFTEEVEKEICSLDATDSRKALTAIINCLDSYAPETVIEKKYETCKELEQLRQGELRIYVRLITDIPDYNVLWVFAIKKHQYRNIGKYDAKACRKVKDLNALTDKKEVEGYILRNEALTLKRLENIKQQQ